MLKMSISYQPPFPRSAVLTFHAKLDSVIQVQQAGSLSAEFLLPTARIPRSHQLGLVHQPSPAVHLELGL